MAAFGFYSNLDNIQTPIFKLLGRDALYVTKG